MLGRVGGALLTDVSGGPVDPHLNYPETVAWILATYEGGTQQYACLTQDINSYNRI